jgi:hypothetical protein
MVFTRGSLDFIIHGFGDVFDQSMTEHRMINGSDTITGDKPKIKDDMEWLKPITYIYFLRVLHPQLDLLPDVHIFIIH